MFNGDYFYAGIFDGHGGSEAAEYAAANLHLQIKKLLILNDPLEALKLAFIATDIGIHNLKISSGTTASVILVKNNHAFLANVGDSAIYIKRPTSPARQLTIDHHLTDSNELKKYQSSKWFWKRAGLYLKVKLRALS